MFNIVVVVVVVVIFVVVVDHLLGGDHAACHLPFWFLSTALFCLTNRTAKCLVLCS